MDTDSCPWVSFGNINNGRTITSHYASHLGMVRTAVDMAAHGQCRTVHGVNVPGNGRS